VSWIPGWDSITSAHSWSNIYFWASICSLILLGVFEVFSHRYSERKDELAAVEQSDAQRRHNEEIARLHLETATANERTEQLRAENLTLQRVMTARHVGLIGFDGPAPADKWFANIGVYSGMDLFIQVTPGDPEAENLAKEIAIAVRAHGWKPQFISEPTSHVSLMEGVNIMSTMSGKPWTESDPVSQQDSKNAGAGDLLAATLTAAGLGLADFPIRCTRLPPNPQHAPLIPWFDPPISGVYIQVGSRPVDLTMQILANKRRTSGTR
jgi:hypothetical protein